MNADRDHVAAPASAARRRRRPRCPARFSPTMRCTRPSWSTSSRRHWLFLASGAEIPEGGDYRTYQIGPWPIFLLRRDDGSIAAFHNTCRHRGSRILQQDTGMAGATLMCPYHRWTYDQDGRVIGCGAHRGDAPATAPLKPVHVRQLAGLIFVCLADAPPARLRRDGRAHDALSRPAHLRHAKVAKQTEIIEHGNWKLTIENNRECFHCAGHPELLTRCSISSARSTRRDVGQGAREYWRFLAARDSHRRSGTVRPAVRADRGAARPADGISHRAPGARRRR